MTFDDLDRSALHVASRYGRTEMLRRLLDKLVGVVVHEVVGVHVVYPCCVCRSSRPVCAQITRSTDPEPLTYSELVNRPDGHVRVASSRVDRMLRRHNTHHRGGRACTTQHCRKIWTRSNSCWTTRLVVEVSGCWQRVHIVCVCGQVGARTYARSTQNKMAVDIAEHINTRNLLRCAMLGYCLMRAALIALSFTAGST